MLSAQSADEAQDLGLHRHVQRGRGLVRDEQIRLAAHRDRQEDPLDHPAGQLVDVLGGDPVRVVQPHVRQQLPSPLRCLRPRQPLRMPQHLIDLRAQRQMRGEPRRRILEHAADPLTREVDRPPGHLHAVRQRAQQRLDRQRLAGPGLAQDPHAGPARHPQVHPAHQRPAGLRGDPQPVDREEIIRCRAPGPGRDRPRGRSRFRTRGDLLLRASSGIGRDVRGGRPDRLRSVVTGCCGVAGLRVLDLRIRALPVLVDAGLGKVADAVCEDAQRRDGHHDRERRCHWIEGAQSEVGQISGEHPAPRGSRRLDAHTQEREARDDQQAGRQRTRRRHEQHRHDPRQHVREDDPDDGHTEEARGLHVLRLRRPQHRGTDDADERGCGQHSHRDHRRVDAVAQQRADRHGERDEGQRHERIDDPLDDPPDRPRAEHGGESRGGAQEQGDEHGLGGGQHGQARAGQQAGQDVAAQVVRAQPVRGGRSGEDIRRVLRERVVRGDQLAERHDERDDDEDRERDGGAGTGQERAERGHGVSLVESERDPVRSCGCRAASSRSRTTVLASTTTTVTMTAARTTGMSPCVAPS